ncbi:unnamed protein product [Effrenium voratum]|nr:unnamed protein product [Effrenium voratum]
MAVWEVIGTKGILARTMKDTSSEALGERLATGALVLELAKEGERLQYRLLEGRGPASGWVSLAVQGKPLLTRFEKLWVACGGAGKGGLLVREGRELTSSALGERLATGALVKELELSDGRLHYALLSGQGPAQGWVSTQVAGKDLMQRSSQVDGLEDCPDPRPSPKQKLRILALAGSISCKELLRYQCGQLAAALGKDDADWTYAEGTLEHPWDLVKISDFEKAVAKRKQLFSWYMDIYHCNKDRPVIEKQFDPEVDVESVDIPQKVAELRKVIDEEGPFDVLLGFSQGCIMIHYLIGHIWQESAALPWKLSIFFEGMHIRDRRYSHLFPSPLPHPSIHVFGKSSPYYDYAREGWCSDRRVEEYYADPLVLTHEEGHNFPSKKDIYSRISSEVKRIICRELSEARGNGGECAEAEAQDLREELFAARRQQEVLREEVTELAAWRFPASLREKADELSEVRLYQNELGEAREALLKMQSDFEAREASMREGECSAREALMKMQSDFEAREASMREGECSAREASMREGECSAREALMKMQSDFEAREASMREGECSAREALMKMQSDFEAREASMREGECSVSENACAECVVLREKLRGAQDEARKASARAAAASKAWGR